MFTFVSQATLEVVSQVPLTTNEEFKAAVFSAKRAFPLWRNTPITTRQRIMFKFQELIRRDIVILFNFCLNVCFHATFFVNWESKFGLRIRLLCALHWNMEKD